MRSVRDLPMLCAGGAADVKREQERRAEITIKGGWSPLFIQCSTRQATSAADCNVNQTEGSHIKGKLQFL